MISKYNLYVKLKKKIICRSHDCEKDHKSTHQILKEKKSDEKNRAKAVEIIEREDKNKISKNGKKC